MSTDLAVPSVSSKRHQFPAEIISHRVWLSHRCGLSLRDAQALMAARRRRHVRDRAPMGPEVRSRIRAGLTLPAAPWRQVALCGLRDSAADNVAPVFRHGE